MKGGPDPAGGRPSFCWRVGGRGAGGRSAARGEVSGEILDSLAAELLHHLGELTHEHGHDVRPAACSHGADGVHEGPAHEGEAGAAREGAGHVRAAPHAAVEENLHAIAELGGEALVDIRLARPLTRNGSFIALG